MSKLKIAVIGASLIWILYVVYLDILYQKFPSVLLGGAENFVRSLFSLLPHLLCLRCHRKIIPARLASIFWHTEYRRFLWVLKDHRLIRKTGYPIASPVGPLIFSLTGSTEKRLDQKISVPATMVDLDLRH